MNELLTKIKEKFNTIWSRLTKIQKIIISVSLFGFLAFLIVFSTVANKINYEPLFTGLEAKDAAAIKAQLDKMAVPYKITDNGSTIEVDSKNKYAIRLDLAKNGAMPNGGVVGFEIFDTTKIGATDFDKKMMFLRAQKGELERTIGSMSNVKKATVNITPANDSVFADEKSLAKASILIEPASPFEKFSDESIRSIMVLAASAVEGLNVDNIEVIDTFGNILSERVEFDNNSGAAVTTKKIALQKEVEKNLEKSVATVLGMLGSGNYKITTMAELDFDKELVDKEQYTTPTVSGEQMKEGLVRSKQENSETYRGGNTSASGIAGTSSNIPGYVGTTGNQNGKEYSKTSNIVNYEMDKTNVKYEKALGKIRKVSISVVLNSNSPYFKTTQFNDVEKKKFEDIVKSAISFDEKRGDSINIAAMPFNTEFIDKFNADEAKKKKTEMFAWVAVAVIIFLFLIAVFVYVAKKKKELEKLQEEERKKFEELIPEFEEITMGDQLTAEEQERREKEDQIKQIARERPEEVANLLRTWMNEE